MDQQMNAVANDPALAHIAGLNWWTSLLADEETVRFVGKLYRHYAIEGKPTCSRPIPLSSRISRTPISSTAPRAGRCIAAEEGSIAAKSFPRYGRIEGRYMGLIRPADPEHIGDTFLSDETQPRKARTPFRKPSRICSPAGSTPLKCLSAITTTSARPSRRNRRRLKPAPAW